MTRTMKRRKTSGTTNDDLDSILDGRYYNINKRLLCYDGLWPYQSVFQRKTRSSFLILVSFSLMVPQILELIQSWGQIYRSIECFSPLVTNIGSNIKLIHCIIHNQKIKKLLDEILNDWACTRDLPELTILHEHGQTGRRFTIAYLTIVYTAVAAWTSVPLIPIAMDYIIPLNESRPHIKYFATEYHVDPDKYFYPIFLHAAAVTFLCMLVYVAVDTTYMMFAQHACAMFDVLRYRLENMTEMYDEDSIRPNNDIQEDVYYQHMAECVRRHKRSLEFIRLMQESCQWYLLILAGLNMLVISVTCSQIVAKGTSTVDALRFTFFTLAQVVHLFCNSLPGQWIMETSALIPISVYSSKWYLMSTRTRELIVLFIRRSKEPCVITAGKLYVMSMENFCRVLQTSMSYVTLLCSMQ